MSATPTSSSCISCISWRTAYRFGREANNPWQQRYAASLRLSALVSAGESEEADRSFVEFHNLRRASGDTLFAYPDIWVGVAWIGSLLRKGRSAEARVACERLAADIRSGGLWGAPVHRSQSLVATGLTELHAQLERPSLGSRRRVRRLVRQLRSRMPMIQGQADALEGGLLDIEGKPERALAAWRRAQANFAEAGCRAQLAAVDYRCAGLLGGDEGEALRARADHYFAEQHIADVDSFVRSFVPARE